MKVFTNIHLSKQNNANMESKMTVKDSIASEIYRKLKGAGKRKYIRLDHLKNFLSLEDDVYKRAISVLKLPKTKSGLSVISGYGLNFSHSIRYDCSALSKFIGIDVVIDDNTGGYYGGRYLKEHKTNGNDLVVIVNKKRRVPTEFFEVIIDEYIRNGMENIKSIFSNQVSCEYVSFVSRAEKEESNRAERVRRGIDGWIKDKIYINPDDSSDYYFMLNGMSFRWHTHHYNWPTCMTEQRTPNNREAKIIKDGLSRGVFKDVFMFDEEGMAISASCFS